MKNKIIYHICLASEYKHLSNIIIKHELFKEEHRLFYIIICNKGTEENKYKKFFEERDQDNFKIINKVGLYRKSLHLYYNMVWVKHLLKIRKDIIVFHGNTLRCLSSFVLLQIGLFPNSVLINWGDTNVYKKDKGETITKRILLLLRNFVYLREFRKFHVIALTSPDKRILSVFKPKSIATIPYPNSMSKQQFDDINVAVDENLILLGNNRYRIDGYLDFLKGVPDVNSEYKIKVMFNYGNYKEEAQEELVNLLKRKFDTRYDLLTDYLSKEDFIKMIKECSFYVCKSKRQTGLAVIFRALFLGKTIYLSGVNYLWVKHLGLQAYTINDFYSDYPKLRKLSLSKQEKNASLILQVLDNRINVPLFYNFIDNIYEEQ